MADGEALEASTPRGLVVADVAWNELDEDLQVIFTKRTALFGPGNTPAEYWAMMRPKDRTTWIYNERNVKVTETWAEDAARVEAGADAATNEAFKARPVPDPIPRDYDSGRLHLLSIDFSPDGPFWNAEDEGDEWLIPDFVARGRGHALYAGAKTGKSLIALDAIAAACIPGHKAWTNVPDGERITVVYLDYEMTEADIRARLESFGYGPKDDYSQFNYVRAMAFGSDLDTHEGGAELLEYALDRKADLVVVDTMSRAVRGDENDADTIRHFYQATGGLLKGHDIALMRLDHAGKSSDKGQRGSSGKNDDVDVVWRLDRKDDGVVMSCTHKRMQWVPETVSIRYQEDEQIGRTYLTRTDAEAQMFVKGVKEKAAEIDDLGLPDDATRQQIKAAGVKAGSRLIADTIRFRKERIERGLVS